MTSPAIAAKLRRIRARLHELGQELDELLTPEALRPGDSEVAELLLPAWWSALGSETVTLAEVRGVHTGTELADVIRRFDARFPDRPARARQALGELVSRIAESAQTVAGYQLRRIGREANVAVWACSPQDVPQDPMRS